MASAHDALPQPDQKVERSFQADLRLMDTSMKEIQEWLGHTHFSTTAIFCQGNEQQPKYIK